MSNLNYQKQRILACPIRKDGADENGTFGDCLKTAVASMLGMKYEDVPHFAMYLSWWEHMVLWGRSRGFDFVCLSPEDIEEYFEPEVVFIASGPSPRGNFWHSVLYDGSFQMVHDPHPSGQGIESIGDCILIIPKLGFRFVYQLELESGNAAN